MNKAFPLMAAMGIAVLAASPAYAAPDGVINFQGELTGTTCTINVDNNKGANATVTLPTVTTNNLAATGDTAGRTSFSIDLTGCSPSVQSALTHFEDSGTVMADGRLSNMATGGATNVALELLHQGSGDRIAAGSEDQKNGPKATADSSGMVSMKYAVQYYATDATTAGAVSSQVTYSINYM